MREKLLILLFILSALHVKADNNLVISSGTEQSIAANGIYVLNGTESGTITLSENVNATIKLQDNVTITGNIIVPENASLIINGENKNLIVSGYIGNESGNDSNYDGKSCGSIELENLNLTAEYIGAGSGKKGNSSFENPPQGGKSGSFIGNLSIKSSSIVINKYIGAGNGGNGGEALKDRPAASGSPGGDFNGNINLSDSKINLSGHIGAGNGGNGGYCRSYNIGGNGGEGGNFKGDITISNTSINLSDYVGAGKGGNGGNSYYAETCIKGANGGNFIGKMSISSSVIISKYGIGEGAGGFGGRSDKAPTADNGEKGNLSGEIEKSNYCIVAEEKGEVSGTVSVSVDINLKELTLKSASSFTNNNVIYINEKLVVENNVTVSGLGKIILGPKAIVEGTLSDLYYDVNIFFRKGNQDWKDVDKELSLKNHNIVQSIKWNHQENSNKYTGLLNLNDLEEYNLFIGELDTKQVINKTTRSLTLDYYRLSFDIGYGITGTKPEDQYLLKDVEYPNEPEITFNKNYYYFSHWSENGEKIDFSTATINKNTYYTVNWAANEIILKSDPIKQELTYNIPMNDYNLSELLNSDTEAKCGKITYSLKEDSYLPYGIDVSNNGIISGTPIDKPSDDIYVTIIAKASGNSSTKEIPIAFNISKSTPVIAKFESISSPYTYNKEAVVISTPTIGEGGEELTTKLTYYTSYTQDIQTQTSIEDGAEEAGRAPVNAGDYIVVATFDEDDYYKAAEEKTAKFTIDKRELTITPVNDQLIYADEAPLYTIDNMIEGETPLFDGALKIEEGQIVTDDFKLKSEFDRNYSLSFILDNITFTASDQNVGEVEVTLDPLESSGWYTKDILFEAPDGFDIALSNSEINPSDLNTLTYGTSFTWETEGKHEVTYALQRKDGINKDKIYTHDKTVWLDKTAPSADITTNYLSYELTFSDAHSGIATVAIDGQTVLSDPTVTSYKGNGDSGEHTATITDKAGNVTTKQFELEKYTPPYIPPTYYDVTLPTVEGVTTNPAAGKHSVREYRSFSFSLTVEEGYREASQPVVKANGLVIAPRISDGKYILSSVTRDTEITIEGIVRDTPTANAEIDNGLYIRQSPHTLHITTPKAIRIRLIDFAGRIIRDTLLSPGENHLYNIAAGSYILQPENEEGIKVRVN